MQGSRGLASSLLATALVFAGGCYAASENDELSHRRPALTIADVNDLFAFAEAQILKTEQRLDLTVHPLYTGADYQGGVWETGPTTDWRSPFLAGLEWLLFSNLGNTPNGWRARAEARTLAFDAEVRTAKTHDVGFKTLLSYGLGFALTRNEAYRPKILEGANTLAGRFLPQYGVTQSWDEIGATPVRVIVDNMMNIELFFMAAELTTSAADRDRWLNMGISHAVNTEKNHMRHGSNVAYDGGTCHVFYYDRNVCVTHQGLADSSTWSRGQAWAMHGFTTTYRYAKKYPQYATQARRFLDAAQRASNNYLMRLSESKHGDNIPLHDFDAAAGAPKDTSAAAVAASALVELSTVAEVREPVRAYYKTAAEKMMDDLRAPTRGYREPPGVLATPRESLLLRATTSFSDVGAGKVQIERGLIYADYYFLEALLRYKRAYDVPIVAPDAGPPPDARDAGDATDTGTPADTAVVDAGPADVAPVDAAVEQAADLSMERTTDVAADKPGDDTEPPRPGTDAAIDLPPPPADAPVAETRPTDAASDRKPNPASSGCGCAVNNEPSPQNNLLLLLLVAASIRARRQRHPFR